MEEEISLREIIEIMLKRKWLIVVITLLATLAGAAFTYMPQRAPLYRTEAKIRIEQLSPVSFKPSTSGYFSTLITALMDAEQYNAEIFDALIRHPDLLSEVRQQLHFDERGIPAGYLTRSLETTVDANKTTLTISFAHNDPDVAREVVNTVLAEFKEFLSSRQRERIDLVASNLERLISLELEGMNASLHGLETARAGYEPLITYRETSHLTPEYDVLSADIARLVSQIAQMEAEQKEIEEFRISVANMLRKVEDWVIITPASSVTDVTPGTGKLTVAIAGTLGLMAGVFLAFFINYWKESAPATVAK